MKSRTRFYTISIVAIVAILIAFLILFLSPLKASNETYIREGDNDWSLDNDQTVYGKTYWSIYADYMRDETIERSETIKLYYCKYWGDILINKETMTWEKDVGTYSSKSLTLNDLMIRWQDSASVFKFNYEDEYYKVSFTIPKLENGDYKYSDLTEAWEKGELYQTIEKW